MACLALGTLKVIVAEHDALPVKYAVAVVVWPSVVAAGTPVRENDCGLTGLSIVVVLPSHSITSLPFGSPKATIPSNV